MSVTWNGSVIDINEPAVLIYHDEILVDYSNTGIGNTIEGALICSSGDRETARWRFPNSDVVDPVVSSNADDIQQIREAAVSQSRTRLSRSRQGLMLTDDYHNGLWTCRVDDGSVPIPVGFYYRGK